MTPTSGGRCRRASPRRAPARPSPVPTIVSTQRAATADWVAVGAEEDLTDLDAAVFHPLADDDLGLADRLTLRFLRRLVVDMTTAERATRKAGRTRASRSAPRPKARACSSRPWRHYGQSRRIGLTPGVPSSTPDAVTDPNHPRPGRHHHTRGVHSAANLAKFSRLFADPRRRMVHEPCDGRPRRSGLEQAARYRTP